MAKNNKEVKACPIFGWEFSKTVKLVILMLVVAVIVNVFFG